MKKVIRNKQELNKLVEYISKFKLKEPIVVEIEKLEKSKTEQQNKTFHSLLQAFWESGCSSFYNYEDLRNYYKRLAGLIQYKQVLELKEETKHTLKECIKILPIDNNEKIVLNKLLLGQVEVHKSWSEVKKDKAKIVIEQLINDCIETKAYVSNNRVKTIIDELSNFNENS